MTTLAIKNKMMSYYISLQVMSDNAVIYLLFKNEQTIN
ncbi:hypothetical protein SAMN06269250_0256 [Spirosoma fluviale]|uniref:Uncharacterized protein n=1 Tax=Spirosoma fluviale TaxID=1597977 RepID=A0A286F4U9_9BACT|nr:hypothetical protein SAMN06269250_0256 [Spirosoma fluviale]